MSDALDDSDLTISGMIRHHATATPNAPAIAFDGRRLSYAQLDHEADRLAAALDALGLKAGDRIVWLGKNNDGFAQIAVGVARAKMVLVPINWRLTRKDVRFIAEDCGAALALVSDPFLADCTAALDGVTRVLPADRTEWIGDLPAGFAIDAGAGGDVAALVYTSGTTGLPKGVVLTNRNLLAGNQARRHLEWDSWTSDDTCLLIMPFGHVGGYAVLLRTLYFGAEAVILPEFEPEAVLQAIGAHAISKIALVPAMIQRLLASPNARSTDYSRINLIFYGTSPIETDLLREATRVFGCGFAQGYGASETGGGVVALTPDDHRAEDGRLLPAAGKAMPGVEIRIVDEDNAPVGNDEVGEIVIRSECVMQGYWSRPDEKPIDADGWYHSGDAGSIDAEGYLWIRSRIKDMIISGGENIYPAEIENVLFGHDDVAEVAVIGIPDADWGEAVAAFVVPASGRVVDPPSVIAWSKQHLARFKAPRAIFVIDALPRNATGKVQKNELRAPFWKGRSRQVG